MNMNRYIFLEASWNYIKVFSKDKIVSRLIRDIEKINEKPIRGPLLSKSH